MPTIRQLIQTSPAKANELFAKLVETSGNAVKTRERLFSELKEELELQMKLEEQHLFPVLESGKRQRTSCPTRSTTTRKPVKPDRAGAHPEGERGVRQQGGRAEKSLPAACA